jgi:phage/plasmid-like protein (TIGR03299 family)
MTRGNTNTINGPRYGAETNGRDLPWDVMGEALKTPHATNFDKALKVAGMDYDVEVWDSQAVDPLTGRVQAHDKGKKIVRPTPDGMAVIGQTGARFTPTQNRDGFAIARDLVGDFGATISGLADFRHGAASIMALDLNNPLVLLRKRKDGPTSQDEVDLFLVVTNRHDGNGALTFSLTSVRVPCTNVLPVVTKDARQVWKVAHTPNQGERIGLVHDMIREAVGFREEVQAKAQAMVDQKMTDAEFAKIVANIFPVHPDAEGAVAERKRETQARIVNNYRDSVTLDGIRGTRWGGYNALTEYLDHMRPVKGGEDAQAVARAEGQIDGPNVRVKTRLWNMFAAA